MDKKITDSIIYIGVDDKDIDLFESQYVVPNYNSVVYMHSGNHCRCEKKQIFCTFFHIITSLFLSEKFDILILYSYNYIITKKKFYTIIFYNCF